MDDKKNCSTCKHGTVAYCQDCLMTTTVYTKYEPRENLVSIPVHKIKGKEYVLYDDVLKILAQMKGEADD